MSWPKADIACIRIKFTKWHVTFFCIFTFYVFAAYSLEFNGPTQSNLRKQFLWKENLENVVTGASGFVQRRPPDSCSTQTVSPSTYGKTAELPTEARIQLEPCKKMVPTLGDPLTTRFPWIPPANGTAKKNVKTYTPLCGTVNTPLEALYASPTLEMTCGIKIISLFSNFCLCLQKYKQ